MQGKLVTQHLAVAAGELRGNLVVAHLLLSLVIYRLIGLVALQWRVALIIGIECTAILGIAPFAALDTVETGS